VRLLLPPSESKNDGRTDSPLDLTMLSFPELTATRAKAIAALEKLSTKAKTARTALGISEKQDFERLRNVDLLTASTSPAADIYSGVLYEALDLHSLTATQRRRADATILIQSSLFGWLTPADRIPAYRLSGDVTLPRLGTVASLWKKHLQKSLDDELIVDMRSGTYSKFWQPAAHQLAHTVVIKVMQTVTDGRGTRKIAVSHFNKATKGRVARYLLTHKAIATSAAELNELLQAGGWTTEHTDATAKAPHIIEVIVKDL